jgi:hypothetical protein
VKIDLLEQPLACNSGEGVGDGQQHLEIALAQEGRDVSPYFVGKTRARVRLELPAVSGTPVEWHR